MKRCPQCKAEYDRHVDYCFVDGAELVEFGPESPGPLPPPPGSSSRRLLPLVLALALTSMVVLVGVLVVLVTMWSGDSGEDLPAPDEPVMVPPSPSPSGSADEPANVHKIPVRSNPSGAEVWEGNTLLCASTPCTVDHPDHAPIPRVFQLRLDGHASAEVEMADVNVPLQAQLARQSHERPARDPRERSPARVPEPEPERPRDAGSIMDER